MSDGDSEVAHVRSLPSDYIDVQDQSYDPNYISDISMKMQVPDRICLDDGSGAAEMAAGLYHPVPGSGRQQFSLMHVPDRIIVAGDNQHIGLREGQRKSPLDADFVRELPNSVGMTTPPDRLTLDQGFPQVDESSSTLTESHDQQLLPNGHLNTPVPYTPGGTPSDSMVLSEEDEATLLRFQVAKLSRRITGIEQDSQRRAQRETGLYIALFGYFLWKVVWSFFRR